MNINEFAILFPKVCPLFFLDILMSQADMTKVRIMSAKNKLHSSKSKIKWSLITREWGWDVETFFGVVSWHRLPLVEELGWWLEQLEISWEYSHSAFLRQGPNRKCLHFLFWFIVCPDSAYILVLRLIFKGNCCHYLDLFTAARFSSFFSLS